MRSTSRFIRALALIFVFAVVAHAQDQNPNQPASQASQAGSIAGTVADSTGAVIPGATVTITDAKGVSQIANTDEQGRYSITNLAPGTYKVVVTAQGFGTFQQPVYVLEPGQVGKIDAALVIASEATSIHVQGQKAAQVETENPQISGTITQQEVTAIGLNGRNFTQLITLAPGVSNQTGQDEALVGVKGSVKYSVNGGRTEYNNFDVDGSDVLNAGVNGSQSTLIVYPSLDAIGEVKVLTSNYGAEYGRSASGTVLVTTKTGGQEFHGDVYEFARNELFNSRGFFEQNLPTPLYRRHDFGFTLGGPLFIPSHYNTAKDKTFFFFSEEFRIEKTPTDFNQGVPSLAERGGIGPETTLNSGTTYFGNFTDVCPFANASQEVFFLRSAFPDCPEKEPAGVGNFFLTFPGNQVPIDPNAAILLNTGLIPAPTSTTGCNSTIESCYDAAVSLPTYWREELIRIDHNFTPNLKLTGRYIHDAWSTTTSIPQWGFVQNSFPSVENKFIGPGLDVVTHLTQIVSPTLVNDLMFSYTTDHITLNDQAGPGVATLQRPSSLTMSALFCPTPTSTAAWTPACLTTPNAFDGKMPGIVVGGTNLAYGGNGFAVDPSFEPYHQWNPTSSITDGLTKTFGNHTLQLGVQIVLAQKNEVNPAIGAATGDVQGLLTFSNENSFYTNGNAFADFLQGNIKTFQQDSSQRRYYIRYNTVEPYIQDDWHVTPRLTLNLGVRFSLFGTWQEKAGARYANAYNWQPQAFSSALASQATVDPFTGALLDVGPNRLGTCDPTNPTDTTCATIPLDPNSPDPRLLNGLVQCGANGISRSCMKGHLLNTAPRIGFAWDPTGTGKTSIRAGYGIFYEHGTGDEANIGSLEGSSPLVLDVTKTFTQGYELIAGAAGAANVPAFPINVTEIPRKAVWPYVQQWSLSIERQLPQETVASIAYVGSKGTHLAAELQINQLQPVSAADNPFILDQLPPPSNSLQEAPPVTSSVCNTFGGSNFTLNGNLITSSTPGFVNLEAACYGIFNPSEPAQFPDPNSLRTFAPTIGQIFSLENVADSRYDALQITVRRTKAPLSLELAYTYGHSIDDGSDRFDSSFVNSFDLAANRASSNFDQRHLLNISYVWDFSFSRLLEAVPNFWLWHEAPKNSNSASAANASAPPAKGSWLDDSWFGRHFLQQWQLSGVTTYQSGTPFSVINGGSAVTGISVLDNAGVANGTGAGSYPDIGPINGSGLIPGANNALFTFGPLLGNPNRFVAPTGLTFGDAGRNFLTNPSRFNFDMALLKHFKISERATLELRGEAFNIFNTTQFRIFDADRGNTASNTISCYGGSNNEAGFVDTTIGGLNCLQGNSFLRPVDAHRPRTIQFGVKILF